MLRERRDGSLELRLETSGRKELIRWNLSWMPHVKALGIGCKVYKVDNLKNCGRLFL